MTVPPMQAGCPWSEISNAWLPNIKWCEAQVCGVVVEPANTWSNLAYVILGLGLWLWGRAQRASGASSRGAMAMTFGVAEGVVGVFSFTFHMSYSGYLQILDFAAMFVFVGLTLSLNLVRLGWLTPERRGRVYALGVLGFTALTVGLRFTSFPIQLVTPVLILATVVTEGLVAVRASRARRERREVRTTRYRWFVTSVVLLVGAAACSMADASRAWCDPHDHVWQGHAVWHVLSAVSLACACAFYAQFDGLVGVGRSGVIDARFG